VKNPGTRLELWIVAMMAELYSDAKKRKASGALGGEGDVTAGPFEIEAKDNPTQQSISITEKDWLRTVAAARKVGKIPLFVNENKHGTFVTLRWSDWFNQLREAYGANHD
jgi:hypothetical protein